MTTVIHPSATWVAVIQNPISECVLLWKHEKCAQPSTGVQLKGWVTELSDAAVCLVEWQRLEHEICFIQKSDTLDD